MNTQSEDLLKFLCSKLGGSEKVMEDYRTYQIQGMAKTEGTLDQLFNQASDEDWEDLLRQMTLQNFAEVVLQKKEEDEEPAKKKGPSSHYKSVKAQRDILAFLESQKGPISSSTLFNGVDDGYRTEVWTVLFNLVKKGWVLQEENALNGQFLFSKVVNPGFKLESQEKDVPIVNQVWRVVGKLFLDKRKALVTMGEIHRACSLLSLSKKQISRAVRAFVESGKLNIHSRGVYLRGV